MTDSNLPSMTPDPSDLPKESQQLPKPVQSQVLQPLGKRIPAWRFWAPLLVQFALLVAVPLKSAMTYANGQTVTLQTAPVDPYDLLRGYSQTLRYDISNVDDLKLLPGGASIFSSSDYYSREVRPFYVTLQAPTEQAPTDSAIANPPQAWAPVAVSVDYPENLSPNQIALRGEESRTRVTYGLETYYMPEDQRNDINQHISDVQRSDDRAFVVDIKVDEKGNSVPVSLWVSDQKYRF